MTCPQLLFVCWFSSVLAVTYCMTVDGYSCTCDYRDTVTCILNITANPVGQSNTTYHLEFKPSLGHCENCLAINHSYSCVCKSSPQSTFTTDDSYDIDLCHESGCKKLAEGFMPAQNIQLTPPHQADVQQTPETFNITWKSGYEDHRFLRNDLEYSLLLQTPQGSKELYSKERSELIQKSQLIRGATYCIKVRSKPSPKDYNWIWSKWSPQTCWETEAREVDGYSCTCDYRDTVTCILNITANPVGQSNTTYHLEFKPSLGHCENCLAINHSYSCVCKSSPESLFTSEDSYDIDLCHESGCKKLAEGFMPAQNIQLTPPHQADVQQTPETFNITWKSGYEDHMFLRNDLEYSLLLQTPQGSKELYSKERSELIQKSQLIPGATYCIKVRSKPSPKDYNWIWSKWSPQTCWETEERTAREEQENIFVILTQSLGPVCLVVGVLLFVFSNPAARMKIKTLSHTPSPAPFFQPLFKQHEGNFQEWLSPQGKFVLTYKTEEILTNAVVTVVPKPITKDPEENQDFHNNPTVTQLAFTQCQNSYVGLPGVHEASPPLTVVCAGNTSYTQLPCPVWGFGIGEVEAVVSSPPDDFLEISCADSGCSCEDLTQISECSLPNSPVDHNPPPSSDYCILNKTAEGVVPVLVSKKNSPNVPSDLPQEDDSVKSE